MGALHDGHLQLVRESAKFCTTTVVSVFVNPRQFNNPEDLLKYPKTISQDLQKLSEAGANVVFVPDANQIYTGTEPPEISISPLDSVFEGHFRPGHFKGVVQVLHRFFSIVSPKHVFFGLKDLQQCLVVEKLIAAAFPEIEQHNQPTTRETSGLAMSSRNTRLSQAGLTKAASIYKELMAIKNHQGNVNAYIKESIDVLHQSDIDTEYLALVQLPDMLATDMLNPQQRQALVFAGYLEGVRLIDNILI